MDFIIFAAAKPSIDYARRGVQFFEERLRPLGKVEIRYVKAGSSEEVSARLLEASKGCLRLAMDERGGKLDLTRVGKTRQNLADASS